MDNTLVIAIASDFIGQRKDHVFVVVSSINYFVKAGINLYANIMDALNAFINENGDFPKELIILRTFQ